MKPATFALALVATVVAVATSTPCDLADIQSKLLPNATEGLANCATTTGYDIWAIADFPTEDQAEKIMKTRDCVDFINQINQRANQEIQCDVQIGGVEKDFAGFLVALLTGQTGNETEASASASASTSASMDKEEEPTTTPKPLLDASGSVGDSFTPSTTKPSASNTTDSSAPAACSAGVTVGLLAVASVAMQL